MTILIIEDEIQIALALKESIKRIRPDYDIAAILDSVDASLTWFEKNPSPDLIFSDIQLGDGLAFEIYRQVEITCPVIFCTAYDEYAIEAFNNNGIDYLLKPVTAENLKKSIAKMELFSKPGTTEINIRHLLQVFKEIDLKNKEFKANYLVHYRDKLIPVNILEIMLFTIREDGVQLYTSDNKNYHLNQTLDKIEMNTDPHLFYRANRQQLLAFSAILEIQLASDRKLLVNHSVKEIEPILISKAKASDFLRWLEKR